jgi:2-dehydropantoate 2-reductase
MTQPILVWGGGAIGGVLSAYWARAGVSVLMVDVVAKHVEACRLKGLVISGPVEQFTQVVPSVLVGDVQGLYGTIVLAVKAQATEQALAMLAPHLAPNGYVLSAQNGLNELAIANRVGAARTMGCFVNFGADWLSPGEILFGNRAAVVVGEIDGSVQGRTCEMHRLLSLFEPEAVLTHNIWGYLWGKLAYGAMLFATALTHDSMSVNFADPARYPVFDQLGREVMAVAFARGVVPVGFNGFDPLCFAPGAPESESRASIAALAEFTRHTAKTHSGIYRDLAVRRRTTEVDPQIGIIATLGREAGVQTPAIDCLVALVHDLEGARRHIGWETFSHLLAVCDVARATPPNPRS